MKQLKRFLRIKIKKISFTSISLSNSAVMLEEKSSGLFTADSIVSIINPDNKNISTYTTEAVTKEIYTYDNIIGLNLGAEVEFINTSGWLVKKIHSRTRNNKYCFIKLNGWNSL